MLVLLSLLELEDTGLQPGPSTKVNVVSRFGTTLNGVYEPPRLLKNQDIKSSIENAETEDINKKGDEKKGEDVKKPDIDLSKIKKDETIIKKGKEAKIFIIGTSEIIKNNIIDENGQTPNAIFISNTIDYLNNREDIALMRGKHQRFNLLKDTK